MKLYTKGALTLLAVMALSYSACKKDSSTTPKTQTTTTDYSGVSSQVASNFSAALAGSMGGANPNQGLAPSFGGTYPPGASALCGFVANSNIDYKTNVGDSDQNLCDRCKQIFLRLPFRASDWLYPG